MRSRRGEHGAGSAARSGSSSTWPPTSPSALTSPATAFAASRAGLLMRSGTPCPEANPGARRAGTSRGSRRVSRRVGSSNGAAPAWIRSAPKPADDADAAEVVVLRRPPAHVSTLTFELRERVVVDAGLGVDRLARGVEARPVDGELRLD